MKKNTPRIPSLRWLKKFPIEAMVWLGGLIALAFIPPHSAAHFSICPLYNLGFDFCPGCGLGASISCFFHGEIVRSLETHPLGIFAVIILSLRFIQLTKNHLKLYGQNN